MTRTTFLVVALLMATGCHPRIGGTPGSPAVDCEAKDEMCIEVRDHLEAVRRNIGGWCGTPTVMAATYLFELGPVAVPYLRSALGDRDGPVAEMAAHILVDLGDGQPVLDFCARKRRKFCDWAKSSVAGMAGLSPAGNWRGTFTTRIGKIEKHPLELVIEKAAPLTGKIKPGKEPGFLPMEGGIFAGRYVSFSYPDPDGTTKSRMTLSLSRHQDKTYLSGSVHTADGQHHVTAVELNLVPAEKAESKGDTREKQAETALKKALCANEINDEVMAHTERLAKAYEKNDKVRGGINAKKMFSRMKESSLGPHMETLSGLAEEESSQMLARVQRLSKDLFTECKERFPTEKAAERLLAYTIMLCTP